MLCFVLRLQTSVTSNQHFVGRWCFMSKRADRKWLVADVGHINDPIYVTYLDSLMTWKHTESVDISRTVSNKMTVYLVGYASSFLSFMPWCGAMACVFRWPSLLGTKHPTNRTGVPLLSKECFLHIYSTTIFNYIFWDLLHNLSLFHHKMSGIS
jgi:hypothetical protein